MRLNEICEKNKHRNLKIAYPPFAMLTPQQAAGYSAIFKTDFWLLLATVAEQRGIRPSE